MSWSRTSTTIKTCRARARPLSAYHSRDRSRFSLPRAPSSRVCPPHWQSCRKAWLSLAVFPRLMAPAQPREMGPCWSSIALAHKYKPSRTKTISTVLRDMAVYDFGGGKIDAFIANGLSGAITRFDMTISNGALTVQSKTTIASGYLFQCDPVTFVDAPTGLVYDPKKDILYVASTVDNAVFAVSKASQRDDDGGTGKVIYQDPTHLHGALAMAAAPNGDLLVSNNDAINGDPKQPSEIVEFTLTGHFVKQLSVDPAQGGSFGLNVLSTGLTSRFAAVDDNQSTLSIWTLPRH